jgi:hypothetical protein
VREHYTEVFAEAFFKKPKEKRKAPKFPQFEGIVYERENQLFKNA